VSDVSKGFGSNRGLITVLSVYLPEGTEENHKNSVCTSIPASSEYKNRALTLPTRSVNFLYQNWAQETKLGGGGGGEENLKGC
jgi:hypothetical protein